MSHSNTTHRLNEGLINRIFAAAQTHIEAELAKLGFTDTGSSYDRSNATLTLRAQFDVGGDLTISAHADITTRSGKWRSHDVEARWLDDAITEALSRHRRDRDIAPLTLPRALPAPVPTTIDSPADADEASVEVPF